ncbi:MAG: AAA family ATPase [Chitinivibrionales bacterium]|nr:AAA family ATPase [Chitinivibrionales bacterium]
MKIQPWSDNPRWHESDPKMVELRSAPVQFPHTSRLAAEIPIKPAGIVLLRGPRQVGKSTLLRQFAQRCIHDGVAPESVVLFDVEELEDRHQLAGELRAFRNSRKGYCIVLLDEFTSIEKWWLALKTLADGGVLADTLVLGTGSSSYDIAEGADLMPGRRGKRYPVDFELLPLSYRDVADKVTLDEYFLTGGFPHALNEFLSKGIIPAYVYDLYFSWIAGLFIKRNRSIHHLPLLLQYLGRHAGSTMSVQKLSRDCGIGSNNTGEEYVEIMERGYTLLTALWAAPDGGAVSVRKNRKFYPADPFLFHVFAHAGAGWETAFASARDRMNDPETCGALAETIVATEIRRQTNSGKLHYWSGKKEIDFVAKTLVEVKYRNVVRADEFAWVEPMLQSGQKFVVVTKDINAVKGGIELIALKRWLTE